MPLALLLSLFGGIGSLIGLFGATRADITEPDTNRPTDEDDGTDTTDDGGNDIPDTPDDVPDTGDGGGTDTGDDGTGDSNDTPDIPDSGTDTGDGGGTDTGDESDHSDHPAPPALTPPGIGASLAEITQYLSDLAALPEGHSHDDSAIASEHMAALALVPRGEATHVAIGDGDWFDPNTWASGNVPGDDAKVLIPEGVTVGYAGVSDARIFTLRVDGKLDFATDTDSQLIFDTVVVSPTGHLEIGTESDPVDPNVNIDLIVANNGPIDTNWDPTLLSRGLIAHGKTEIYGAVKDSHDKVTEDPMAGDTSVKFDGVPEGWQVGDTIVIASTHYERFTKDANSTPIFNGNQDEVRTITQIDEDGTIHFADPLVFDHDSPRDDLATSVANYTRNVSIETEDAETAEVFERGHVMFMHNDDVDVYYAEFHELGRTDKSTDSFQADDFANIAFDSNVQGRYSLHVHRAGTDDLEDPAMLVGNAVFGSPGWGYVHHDSNAVLINNASFDTFGAGYVAETGNETGLWADNIAIFAQGNGYGIPKLSSEIGDDIFDTARGGEGFWFQGRLVAAIDNVAASVNTGFAYFHRNGDDRMIAYDADLFAYPAALYYEDTDKADDSPILGFVGNETIAAREGLHIVKGNPMQGHDVQSHLVDFTAWNVINGAHLQYTAHYILEDFDVIGVGAVAHEKSTGILFEANTSEITVINPTIDNFENGMDFLKHFTRPYWTDDMHHFVVIDPNISNVDVEFLNYDPSLDTVTTLGSLPMLDIDLQLDGPLQFTYDSEGFAKVLITGTKTDSLGTFEFPNGTDKYQIQKDHVQTLVHEKGYYTTSTGQDYFLVDIYTTDRLTAEVFYETHAVFIDPSINMGRGDYQDATFNGVQDITSSNGSLWAGSTQLDTAIPAVIEGGFDHVGFLSSLTQTATSSVMTATESAMMAEETPSTSEIWVSDGQMEFADGEAMLLVGSDAMFDLSSTEAETAVLDFNAGSTVTFVADADGLGTIAEQDPDQGVLSGIDLADATLEIDLSGLNAEAGTSFTLMDSDELAGVFEQAIIGGLGPLDARIVVDYEADQVRLELTEGSGSISVDTLGEEAQVTQGNEALWDLLTKDQTVLDEIDDEIEQDHMAMAM